MIGSTLSDRAAVSSEGIKADAMAVSKPVTFPLGRSSRGTMPVPQDSAVLR
jgi:hypothetical protein